VAQTQFGQQFHGTNAVAMSQRYKAIAFDFFGVLCSRVAPRWVEQHCASERKREVREHVLDRVDRGEITQQEMFERLAGIAGCQASAVESQWYALAAVDHEMIALLHELQPAFKLALLTNASWPFVRSLLRQVDIERVIDCIVISSECGHAKPDAAIYKRMLDLLGEQAASVIFIDDTRENVVAAKRAGVTGVLFRNLRDLRQVLRQMEVLRPLRRV
jgi:putative hydrolase of the HAD superfamily